MNDLPADAVRVTVPCSTSNLGAGFDCLGLALDRHLIATYTPGTSFLQVERLGTLAELPANGEDLVVRLLRERASQLTGTLTLGSTIPIGKGLGSSAAAIVAALALVAAITKEDLQYDAALQAATEVEGHPDNAAPALMGGLVGVVRDGARTRALQLYLSEEVGFAFAAPRAVISTKAARKALPEHISHAAAARGISRTVALIEGFAEADPELLRIGFDDELHVPYRIGMIPGGAHALSAALEAGAWAATISGSGSGLIAVCERGREAEIVEAMSSAFRAATSETAVAFVANPDFAGVQVERAA